MDPHMERYYKSEIENDTTHVFMIDYEISNELLTLVDAVISPLSTMLVEAMLFGKPILIFFPREYENQELGSDEVHFAELISVPQVNVSFYKQKFIEGLTRMKTQIGDRADSAALRQAAVFFNNSENESYASRLNALVENLSKTSPKYSER